MNSLFLTQLILIGVQLLPLEESCLMQTPSMFPTYIHSPRSEYLLCALVKLLLTTRPPFLPFSALLSWGGQRWVTDLQTITMPRLSDPF